MIFIIRHNGERENVGAGTLHRMLPPPSGVGVEQILELKME